MSYSRRSRYSRSPSPYRHGNRSISRSSSRSRSRDSSDAENPGNNLYVTGLSTRVSRRDLEKHFSTEGKVDDVRLVVDPWTQESRGFGFVTMSTVDEADRCVKYLDRSVLQGRVITVEKARRRRGRTPTPGRYLGLRTVHARVRSPTYSRSVSPCYSSERERGSRRTYSPYYDRRRQFYSSYHGRRSYSPPYYRCERSYSHSRSPSYSKSPVERREQSYSPTYHNYYSHHRRRSYSPPYYRRERSYSRSRSRSPSYCTSPVERREQSYSPTYHNYCSHHRHRSYSPPYYRRERSYSRSRSPSYSRSPVERREQSYSPTYHNYYSRDKRFYQRQYRSSPETPDDFKYRRSRSRSRSPRRISLLHRRGGRKNSRSISPRRSRRSYSGSGSPKYYRRSYSQSVSCGDSRSSRSHSRSPSADSTSHSG